MRHELLVTAVRVAMRLRNAGLRVGTSEVLESLRIAENLAMLEGRDEPSLDDVYTAMRAVVAKSSRDEEMFDRVWREVTTSRQQCVARMLAAVEEDLKKLGLSWGSRIYSKRRLLSGPHADERREAYSRLKLLGLIVRTSRGDVVLDRESALRRLRRIASSYSSPWEALAESAARLISRGRIEWFTLYAAPVDEEKLAGVELDRIAAAGLQALQEGNRGLARKLAGIVSRRLEAGETPRDSWSAYRLLDELELLTPRSLASLLRGEPRLVEHLLRSRETRDMLAEALRYLDPVSLRGILRKLVRDKRGLGIAASLVGEVDLSVWTEVNMSRQPRTWEEAVIAAVSSLARAEREFLAAASGGEAHLDMAFYELERFKRIDYSGAPDWAVSAIERYAERVEHLRSAFESRVDAYARLSAIVKSMSPDEALLYLRSIYRSGDEELKRVALRLAELLWRRLEARVARASRLSPRKQRSTRGRIDVRRTVYNVIALREEPIVAYKRERHPLFALVLDTSGSMAKYSIWALLSASAFAAAVESITLFSSNVTIVRQAYRLSRRRLIELLFRTDFAGYTNISAALRETARVYNTPARMLVVTDACQTVEDTPPHSTVEELSKRGWKLYFILPPRHCVDEREKISAYAMVKLVARPEDIPRIFARVQ